MRSECGCETWKRMKTIHREMGSGDDDDDDDNKVTFVIIKKVQAPYLNSLIS